MVAQAGVPTAVSKLIAENNQIGNFQQGRKVFRFAMLLLGLLGALCAVAMAALSNVIARSQGNAETAKAFLIVAPALVFVPVTNVLKAYFQGNMNMVPSGATTVVEQVVKLCVGLLCALKFMPDVNKAVMGAVLAITVSEFSSLAIMSVVYLVHRKKNPVDLPIKLHKQDVKVRASASFLLQFPLRWAVLPCRCRRWWIP